MTNRIEKIRVISARIAHKNERNYYEKNLKKIPKFNSEEEERKFWQKVDSTKYVDFSKMEKATFPNLKLTSKPITLRLPNILIERIKTRAHIMDVPYQSYIKQILYKHELANTASRLGNR